MKPDCAAFRGAFEPGSSPPHRRRCPDCRAFAAAVEMARRAASRRPLPQDLELRLSALARGEQELASPAAEAPRPVPMLALPQSLEHRLRRIGHQRTPPHWLRSPAATLAASLVFTVMVGSLVENPAAGLIRLADGLERRFERAAEAELPRWEPGDLRQALAPAEARWQRTVSDARLIFKQWVGRLEAALPETTPDTSHER